MLWKPRKERVSKRNGWLPRAKCLETAKRSVKVKTKKRWLWKFDITPRQKMYGKWLNYKAQIWIQPLNNEMWPILIVVEHALWMLKGVPDDYYRTEWDLVAFQVVSVIRHDSAPWRLFHRWNFQTHSLWVLPLHNLHPKKARYVGTSREFLIISNSS